MIDSQKNVEPAALQGDPLQVLISADTCQEILQAMKPTEVIIAYCRLQDLPDIIPAYILGVTIPHLTVIMSRAKARLATQLPELAVLLADRRRLPSQIPPISPPPDLSLAHGPKTAPGQPRSL